MLHILPLWLIQTWISRKQFRLNSEILLKNLSFLANFRKLKYLLFSKKLKWCTQTEKKPRVTSIAVKSEIYIMLIYM